MTYNPLWAIVGNIEANQAKSVARKLYNSTAGTIGKGTPVRISPSGNISTVDPSIESHVDGFLGLAENDILPGQEGNIITSGVIPDIILSANFGDVIFLSKSGVLTNVKPSIGVGGFIAGDWVIRLGVVAKNPDNPTNKDLIVNIQFLGQL